MPPTHEPLAVDPSPDAAADEQPPAAAASPGVAVSPRKPADDSLTAKTQPTAPKPPAANRPDTPPTAAMAPISALEPVGGEPALPDAPPIAATASASAEDPEGGDSATTDVAPGDGFAAEEGAPASRNKRVALRRVLVGVVALLLVGAAATIVLLATSEQTFAKPGDCLIGQDADSMRPLPCADTTAEWKVAGQVDDVTRADFDAAGGNSTACAPYPAATAWFWSGTEDGTGYVLCLEAMRR